MRLVGIRDFIEGEDFIKYKNGHLLLKFDNTIQLIQIDLREYAIVYDNNSFRKIQFNPRQFKGFKEPDNFLYFDEINNTITSLDLYKEIEKIKEVQEFNESFEEKLLD